MPIYNPISVDSFTLAKGLHLDIARLDRIHTNISGNKWFKLKPNLASLDPGTTVASFGGAHSNHIHALAFACSELNLPSVGIIRGEPQLTPTLKDAKAWGMTLHFIDRASYREKICDIEGCEDWYWLPEGGSNSLAVEGCANILPAITQQAGRYDVVYTAVGSGATLAGLIYSAHPDIKLVGVSALGGIADLNDRVAKLLAGCSKPASPSWQIRSGSELRYGKVNASLASLWLRAATLGIDLDPIYTLRVLEKLLSDYRYGLLSDKRVLMLHTGGMQGVRAQLSRIHRLSSNFIGPQPL